MVSDQQPSFFLILLSLGFFSLLRSSLTLLKWLYSAFLRPKKNLKSCYGSWALITGATDGIGRALALRLAGDGLNLLLVGRNPSKLENISNLIKSEFNNTIDTKIIVMDLAGDIDISSLEEAMRGLDVGVVVNNAGTSHPEPLLFHEMGEELWRRIVKVNIEAATAVATAAVAAGMVERRRGALVNIGSGTSTAVPAFPYAAVYAASKAYIDQLSRSLHVEYNSMGINVQCQSPMYVATEMVSITKTSAFVPTSEDYANAGVRWIGYDRLCCPFWPHSIQCWLISLVSKSILNAWLIRRAINKRKKQLINFNENGQKYLDEMRMSKIRSQNEL